MKMMWGLVVTASAAMVALAGTAGTAMVPIAGTALADRDIIQDTSSHVQGSPIYNAESESMSEEGTVFDNWNLNAERAKRKNCIKEGGECIKKKTAEENCLGKLDKKYKCKSKKDICCIPVPGCNTVCPDVVAPICGGTPDGSKLETFSNRECFNQTVKCDPAYADYVFKHDASCACQLQKLPHGSPMCDLGAEEERYYYNWESGRCQKFSYEGCHPNGNNFETYEDCYNTCGNVGAVCPEGFFHVPGSANQCFKFYNGSGLSWNASLSKCQDERLEMAKPVDPVAVRKFLVETFGGNAYAWMGARGTGSSVEWIRDGSVVGRNNPAWFTGPGSSSSTATNQCLLVLASAHWMNVKPTGPYQMNTCTGTNKFALCELPME